MPRIRSIRHPAWGALLLFALVLAAFAISVRGGFLWDDDAHITANPCIIGPLGLREIWTTAAANYFPLVLTNFWLQHAVWGLNPAGYHGVTVLFHAASAVVLWLVLRRLNVAGAWLGAAAWAVHPVQVESVAWICELKNTQSAFFFLGAVWGFLRWLGEEDPGAGGQLPRGPAWAYWFSLAGGVAAILSKPSTVMLPVVLLLCWGWQRRRIGMAALVPVIPFLLIAAGASAWTVWEQKYHSLALGADWNQSFAERSAIAVRVPWFYLEKLVWPQLSFIYPRWDVMTGAVWFPLVATAVSVWAVVVSYRRLPVPTRAVAFAAVYFLTLLFPVLGFFTVYFFRYSFVGDHFQYLASIGPFALFGAAVTCWTGRYARAIGCLFLAAAALVTMVRCRVFLNNESLWIHTLAVNPSSAMAAAQLGAIESLRGNREQAMARFRQALESKPDDYYARNGLGCELLAAGQFPAAVRELQRAVAIDPRNADGHNNLGRALQDCDDLIPARQHYEEALRLRPHHATAHNNLGTLLTQSGDPAGAVLQFRAALRENPVDATVHHNLANALAQLKRFPEALTEYEAALHDEPMAETHDDLGVVLEKLGRTTEARQHFAEAIRLSPALESAHQHLAALQVSLAAALGRAGKLPEALTELDRAIAADPKSSAAHFNRGVALAQLGQWPDAREAFARAVALDPTSSAAHRYLGIALATAGDLEGAAAELEAAVRIDPASAENRQTQLKIQDARQRRSRP